MQTASKTVQGVDSATLVEIYGKMALIREFEEKVFELFGKNLIPGTLHLYSGQEAVAAGVCQALEEKDYVQSTHRGHGHCLAKGADLRGMMAEIFGKWTGLCRGKGGSMHVTDFSHGIIGATGVVASGLPIAVGAALSAAMEKKGRVAVCFFGDGASNNGTFHESLNMAALWKLPLVFVCENNFYAMGTRISKASSVENVSQRAAGYSMPSETVDGNDGLAVFKAARKAVDHARSGKGPWLLECRTYRLRGHSRFDPAKYRPREEVEFWLARDPLARMKALLDDEGILDDEAAGSILRRTREAVEDCARFAMESPDPDASCVTEDVYEEH